MKKTVNRLTRLLCACMALLVLSGCAAPAAPSGEQAPASGKKPILNIYNFTDYIDPQVLEDFKKEYNVDIKYNEFSENEELLGKMQIGGTPFDVIFASEYMMETMQKRDLLTKLDPTTMPDRKNIGAQYLGFPYDPQNEYSLPYMWGTMGICYNKTKVQDPVDSWNILWEEKYKGQIIMLDSARDSLGITLKKLGYSLNTKNPQELEAAKKELIRQKPLVKSYETDSHKANMAAGEAALSLMWSGDAMTVMAENEDLAYAIPKEGTNLWFDNVAIPKSTQYPQEALAFVNYLLKPEVAAKNATYIHYSSPNEAAKPLLSEEDQKNPQLYPSIDIKQIGEVLSDLGEFVQEYNKAWTDVKAAQ